MRLSDVILNDFTSIMGLVLITLGLAIKTALLPFHFWLPGAHASAPAPVSALLSGIVVKASFYILLRLWATVIPGMGIPAQAPLLLTALGLVAVLWGSIQAVRQERAKLILAYSSVAQIGYLFIVFSLISNAEGIFGALYMALSHAFAKAGAFLAVGALMIRVGSDVLNNWKGLAKEEPVLMIALGFSGLSLIGLPPSGGFVGKFILITTSMEAHNYAAVVILVLGGLIASVYIFKIVGLSLRGDVDVACKTTTLSPALRLVPLALATVAIGLMFLPMYFFPLINNG